MAANSPVAYRNEVSYEWERAQHLRDLRAGRMSREELCDADFLLRATVYALE